MGSVPGTVRNFLQLWLLTATGTRSLPRDEDAQPAMRQGRGHAAVHAPRARTRSLPRDKDLTKDRDKDALPARRQGCGAAHELLELAVSDHGERARCGARAVRV